MSHINETKRTVAQKKATDPNTNEVHERERYSKGQRRKREEEVEAFTSFDASGTGKSMLHPIISLHSPFLFRYFVEIRKKNKLSLRLRLCFRWKRVYFICVSFLCKELTKHRQSQLPVTSKARRSRQDPSCVESCHDRHSSMQSLQMR